MSGYPTPLQKIGQSLLCTRSSTQLQTMHILSQTIQYMQYISNISNHMSNTATWAHKQCSIYIPTMNPTIYPIVTRVNMFLLLYNIYQTYRVPIHVNIIKATSGFLLIQPLGRAVPSHAPCTCKKGGSHDGVS